MTDSAKSVNEIAIRLTEEHSELAGRRLEVLETVALPNKIYEGNRAKI